jgi:hypothetical protein
VILEEDQTIGPTPLPVRFPDKIKWMNLSELRHYRAQPEKLTQVRDTIQRVRSLACALHFYNRVIEDFKSDGGRFRLGNARHALDVQAGGMQIDPTDGRVQLTGGVRIEESDPRSRRTITANRATLLAEPGRDLSDPRVAVEVFENVTLTDPDDPSKSANKTRAKLDAVALDPEIVARVVAMPETELLSDVEWESAGALALRRKGEAIDSRGKALREIAGVMHSRLAFSVSAFVLVILAAALGIIFRGAQVLTAFGVAFVPAVFVIVTIVAGRQLAENPTTPLLGLTLLWSGIAVVAGLDGWILLKVLRR